MTLIQEIASIFNLYLEIYYSQPMDRQSWFNTQEFPKEITDQKMYELFERDFFDNEEVTPILMTAKYNKEQFEEIIRLFFFGGIRNGGYNSTENRMLDKSDNYTNLKYAKKITDLIFNKLGGSKYTVFHERYVLDDYEHRAVAENDLNSVGFRVNINNKSYLLTLNWRWD